MSRDEWRSRLGVILRWAVGLGLLALAVRGLDWRNVQAAFGAVDWRWGLAALVSLAASLALKALRWQWLLRGTAPEANWPNLFGALLAGQAVNIVLPVRGGELSRALLVNPASASRVGIAATIGAEKVFDLAALMVLAAGWLPSLFLTGEIGWLGLAASAAGVLGLWVFVWHGEPLWQSVRGWLEHRFARAAPRPSWRTKVLRWGDEVLLSFRPLRSAGSFLAVTGLTAVIWANMLTTNLLLFNAFRLQAPILAGITVLVFIHLGVLPSLMPGNVGPFYFFTKVALLPFGIPAPVALSYAVALHAVVTAPALVGGGLYLLASRRRVADSPST